MKRAIRFATGKTLHYAHSDRKNQDLPEKFQAKKTVNLTLSDFRPKTAVDGSCQIDSNCVAIPVLACSYAPLCWQLDKKSAERGDWHGLCVLPITTPGKAKTTAE